MSNDIAKVEEIEDHMAISPSIMAAPIYSNDLFNPCYQKVRYREVHALVIYEKWDKVKLTGAIDELAGVLEDQYAVFVRQVQVGYTKLSKNSPLRAAEIEILRKEIHYFFQLYSAPDILLLVYCGSSTDSFGKKVWEELRGISGFPVPKSPDPSRRRLRTAVAANSESLVSDTIIIFDCSLPFPKPEGKDKEINLRSNLEIFSARDFGIAKPKKQIPQTFTSALVQELKTAKFPIPFTPEDLFSKVSERIKGPERLFVHIAFGPAPGSLRAGIVMRPFRPAKAAARRAMGKESLAWGPIGEPVEGFVKKFVADGLIMRTYWHDEVADIKYWTRPWSSVSIKGPDEQVWNPNRYARAAKDILIAKLLSSQIQMANSYGELCRMVVLLIQEYRKMVAPAYLADRVAMAPSSDEDTVMEGT